MKQLYSFALGLMVAASVLIGCTSPPTPAPQQDSFSDSQTDLGVHQLEASLLETSKKVQDLALQYTRLHDQVAQADRQTYDALADTLSQALATVSDLLVDKNATINDLNLLNDTIADIQAQLDMLSGTQN